MTFFTAFALVLLPILGGLIAWAGDVIGYRLGKSRRSLFGLRPRVTARLVGVIVGALLVWVTLGVAALGSSQVRDSLFRLRELWEQNEMLSRENAALLSQVQEASERAHSAQTRAEQLDLEIVRARESLARTRAQLEAERARLGAQQALLRAVQSQLQATSRQRDQLQRQREALSADVRAARADLSQAAADLADAHSRLAAAQSDLSQASARNDQLRARNDELAARQSELEARNTQLAQLNTSLEVQQRGLERDVEALKGDMDRFRRQADAARDAMLRAQERANEIEIKLFAWQIASAAAPVAYEPGAEIVSALLRTDQSQAQLEASIGELLHLASSLAATHGAAPGPNGRTVRPVAPVPAGRTGELVPEPEIIAEVARRVRLSATRQYQVSVRALRRLFEGEGTQLQVELWGAPNTRLYRANEAIDSVQMDGGRTRGEVLRDLMAFIQQARRVLTRQGVRPDPKTGQVLTVPAEDILAAMDALTAPGAGGQVVALAAADIYSATEAAEPAIVRLQVRPAASEKPASETVRGESVVRRDNPGRGSGALEVRPGSAVF